MDKYECRCDTGRYCHFHRKYGKIKEAAPIMLSDEQAIDRETGRDFQQCGGGRRLIRKREE